MNRAINAREFTMLRQNVQRGAPVGGEAWSAKLVQALGLPNPPRPRGRPRQAALERDRKNHSR